MGKGGVSPVPEPSPEIGDIGRRAKASTSEAINWRLNGRKRMTCVDQLVSILPIPYAHYCDRFPRASENLGRSSSTVKCGVLNSAPTRRSRDPDLDLSHNLAARWHSSTIRRYALSVATRRL